MQDLAKAEAIAQLLAADLATIGTISYEQRLTGYALLEDGVMFGFVDDTGTAYLRATEATARRFHSLGSTKHPELPYWTIPHALSADSAVLRDVAYQAADEAHIAFSFGIDDAPARTATTMRPLGTIMSFALLAA